MLTASGPKLLDFGLAKTAPALGISSAASGMTPSTPTMTIAELSSPAQPLTRQGTVVGTFQYMAPEQIAPASSAALDHLVKSCLEKNPQERIQTAQDVRLQLKWIAEGGGMSFESVCRAETPVDLVGRGQHGIAGGGGNDGGVYEGSITAKAGDAHVNFASRGDVICHHRAAAQGRRSSRQTAPGWHSRRAMPREKSRLYVRTLSSLTSQALSGTEEAMYPFWSADSQTLGFLRWAS